MTPSPTASLPIEEAEEMDGIVNQQMMGAEYGHEDQDVYFDEFEQAAVHGVHAGVPPAWQLTP